MGIIVFLFSLIPVFIILLLLYTLDDEKESLKTLLFLFGGGCFSLVLIKFLANQLYIFDPDMLYGEVNALQQFFEKFSLIGTVEELSKFVVLYFLVWRNKDFNYVNDGIIYAVFVSMGFAVVENFNYMMEYADIMTLISRSLLTVPAHACFGIIMGSYLGDAKYYRNSNRGFYKYMAFFVPMLLHGLYDYLLSFDNEVFKLFLIYFVILLIYSIRKLVIYLNKGNAQIEGDNIVYEKKF